jgi:hypothetical protein
MERHGQGLSFSQVLVRGLLAATVALPAASALQLSVDPTTGGFTVSIGGDVWYQGEEVVVRAHNQTFRAR